MRSGAIGALGIVLAFTFGGRPIYVMPLVFGGAPVVNAFLTIYLARRVKEIGPLFLAALIIVILGAVMVLVFAPHRAPAAEHANAASAEAAAAPANGTLNGPTNRERVRHLDCATAGYRAGSRELGLVRTSVA